MIDTHIHLIYPEKLNYPWIAGAPALQRTFSLETYLKEATEAGVTGGLFMEVDVATEEIEKEAEWIDSLAKEHSFLLGLIAACRPESDNFTAQLDSLKRYSSLRGLRRILHVVPNELSTTDTFRKNVRSLAEHNLSFDLCLRADQLNLGSELVDECPETVFVLDHCGNPPVTSEDLSAWQISLSMLAERPNVFCKISGLANHCPEGQVDQETLQPVIDHVLECFDPQRCLWGGDWPVSLLADTALPDWAQVTRHLLSSLSAGDQKRIFEGTAKEVYRI